MASHIWDRQREYVDNHIGNHICDMESQEYFKQNQKYYAEFYLHNQTNREIIMKDLEKFGNLTQDIIDQMQQERTIINIKMDNAIKEEEKQREKERITEEKAAKENEKSQNYNFAKDEKS